MTVPRFFLTERALDFKEGDSVAIEESAVVNQVKNVLRMRTGDRITLLNGRGLIFECTITSVEPRTIRCSVDSTETAGGEPPVDVVIALAMIKGERFEWALQKLTEVGARTIIPFISSRTVVKFDTSGDAKGANAKLTRWQSILREAAEQCERGTIPHIVLPKKLTEIIDDAALGGTDDSIFICAERLPVTSLKDIFLGYTCGTEDRSATKRKTITLVVGPEGGFTSEEIEYARKRGVQPVSLGPRILRAETAAIYAVAQVIWCLEK